MNAALESEHEACFANRDAIMESRLIGCFSCLSLMEPSSVKEFVRDGDRQTAICPRCGIDSLIPRMDIKSPMLLLELRKKYFDQ